MLKLSGDAKLISFVQEDELLGWDQEGPKPVGCSPSEMKPGVSLLSCHALLNPYTEIPR